MGSVCFRVQREREYAITALFHCAGNEKIVRWVKSEPGENGFTAQVTKPFSLEPREDGQTQLLTLLSMPSAKIGLDHPSLNLNDSSSVCEVCSWLGTGATSKVYSATWRGRMGAVKILHPEHVDLVEQEVATLKRLTNLLGVPRAERIASNAIFFQRVLLPLERCPRSCVEDLVSCLQSVHELGIVQRDVRPENLMRDVSGSAVLNDWGMSVEAGRVTWFAGTFRYASEEVLNSLINEELRSPQPKDDLHSFVRAVIALNDVDVRKKLSSFGSGCYADVRNFWATWQQENTIRQAFFDGAERLDYEKCLSKYPRRPRPTLPIRIPVLDSIPLARVTLMASSFHEFRKTANSSFAPSDCIGGVPSATLESLADLPPGATEDTIIRVPFVCVHPFKVSNERTQSC